MNYSEMTGGFAQSLNLRGDLQARFADFMARKNLPFSGRLEGFLKLAESTLSRERLKSMLSSLLQRFRRGRLGENDAPDLAEWEGMVERIHRARGEAALESYPQFLFTFDSAF